MKKIVFLSLLCMTFSSHGMQVLERIFSYSYHQEPFTLYRWIELVKKGYYNQARTELNSNLNVIRCNIFLSTTVNESTDQDFLLAFIDEYASMWSEEQIGKALIVATQKNNRACFEALAQLPQVSTELLLEIFSSCRIEAAAVSYTFLNYLIITARKKSLASQKDHPLGILCPLCETICKKIQALPDLNIRDETRLIRTGVVSLGYSLPLHAAVVKNNRETTLLLLMNNASIDQRCLEIAQGSELKNLLELFARWKDQLSRCILPKRRELHKESSQLAELIISCPALASRYIHDNCGATLLHKAVCALDCFLIKVLLEREPLLIEATNNAGFTPLDLALLHHHKVLRWLIEYAYSLRENRST